MSITLQCSLIPVAFKGPWIYLGINILRMRNWERRLTGKRISLSDYITKEANIQRPNILSKTVSSVAACNDNNTVGHTKIIYTTFTCVIC